MIDHMKAFVILSAAKDLEISYRAARIHRGWGCVGKHPERSGILRCAQNDTGCAQNDGKGKKETALLLRRDLRLRLQETA
jgi:hypothetical protein